VLTLAATIGILNEVFPENQNLIAVTRTKPDHPGYHHCVTLMGSMLAKSKHGPHFCLVFEPMGNDLQALQQQQLDRVFPLSATKRIVKQTLLALDYIHTECGLVHTGTACIISEAARESLTHLTRSQALQRVSISRKSSR
jgi:serine/threonine-protein kinase SRPK3